MEGDVRTCVLEQAGVNSGLAHTSYYGSFRITLFKTDVCATLRGLKPAVRLPPFTCVGKA